MPYEKYARNFQIIAFNQSTNEANQQKKEYYKHFSVLAMLFAGNAIVAFILLIYWCLFFFSSSYFDAIKANKTYSC